MLKFTKSKSEDTKIEKGKQKYERKIIFAHKRAFGDSLMFSAGIRDFKLLFPNILINVDSNHNFIFDNNPYLDRSLKRDDLGVEYYRVGYSAITASNSTTIHFCNMFLLDMIAIADHHQKLPISLGEFTAAFANGECGDPDVGNAAKNPTIAYEPFISLREQYRGFCKKFSRQYPDIHLTDQEIKRNLIKDAYGIDKYWVISCSGKRDCTAKTYDARRLQTVINHFKNRIQFVSIGKSDLLTEKLSGVIDLVDKFNKNPRDLFSLVLHSDGCLTNPSMLMHIAAAVNPYRKIGKTPCVAIFGGREPGWSDYTGHQILHTRGVFDCSASGGCWKARIIALQKDVKHNKNLCKHTVQDDGKTIQACMNSISAQDIIKSIERYYSGNLYTYLKQRETVEIEKAKPLEKKENRIEFKSISEVNDKKEINLLGNLNSAGGGEQSLVMIANLLTKAGWKVNLYPMGSVHNNYRNVEVVIKGYNFPTMDKHMRQDLPLLFYANDSIRKFVDDGQKIIEKSQSVIIGINYTNSSLPSCTWLSKTKKVRGIIFQNKEKMAEFKRDQIGFNDTKLISLFGAIDLNKFLEICPVERKMPNDKLIVLKHCTPDFRKYVTKESIKKGDRIHLWQKFLDKELDTKFYSRLLKDINNIEFHFMEAHKELVEYFKNEPRMRFYKFDEIKTTDFLANGHVYLYRVSNLWRDQYPRGLAEALSAGIPALVEPRDGTNDRIVHGDTGFYCVDYDSFKFALKLLYRKEKYRKHIGMNCKDWARDNLDPREWIRIIEDLCK